MGGRRVKLFSFTGLAFLILAYREWRAQRHANKLFVGTMSAIQEHQREIVDDLKRSLGIPAGMLPIKPLGLELLGYCAGCHAPILLVSQGKMAMVFSTASGCCRDSAKAAEEYCKGRLDAKEAVAEVEEMLRGE